MDEQNTKQCNGYEAMYTFLNDEDFERHLKECPQCAKEHEKMQKVSDLIQEAKTYIKQKRKNTRVLVSAAAFFVAVFATLSVPLCMVGIDAYDNLVAQNTMDVQELGLPVDEYGFLYIE